MNPFEKALLQAVNEDFSHVPPEEELDLPVISLRKIRKTNALRRCLMAAAVCVLLIGSVLATYVIRYQIGPVDVETDITKILPFEVDEEYANKNRYYRLTFSETLASDNASDTIETYYLPTYGVNADTLVRPNFWISNTTGVYRPLDDMGFPNDFKGAYVSYEAIYPDLSQEDILKILDAPTCVHYEWTWNNESVIHFDQYSAKRVAEGLRFNNVVTDDQGLTIVSYETIEVDEYSIFTFNIDSCQRFPEEQNQHIARNWYWTNGEYLFQLSGRCSADEMTELFRSVKAVSTQAPYCRDEAQPNKVTESFTLPEESLD